MNDPIMPSPIERPRYLEPVIEPGFGTRLTRIAGDTGSVIHGVIGDWALAARHRYSKEQPWNADGTRYMIGQPSVEGVTVSGTPSKMILDADSWAPAMGNTGVFRSCSEVRWHPVNPDRMFGWYRSASELLEFDPVVNGIYKRIKVEGLTGKNNGFMGEGNPNLAGTMVCLGDESNNVALVNLERGVAGPVQVIAFERQPATGLDNVMISPLATPAGGYVVCHGSDFVRVFRYGPDLVLVPHFEAELKLSHADVGVTPSGREVVVGGSRQWYGAAGGFDERRGKVVAIDLDHGGLTHVSAGLSLTGLKEASDQHCSCRGPRGEVLVTYAGPHETSGLFCMEMVAYPLDGSRVPRARFGVTRTNEQGIYRAEAHGVCRPDGKAVAFASNSQHATVGGIPIHDIKDFVYELVVKPAVKPPYQKIAFSSDYAVADSRGIMLHPDDIVRMLCELHALKNPS